MTADDYDDDDTDCWNCGGEGFVYGCSWDWQCDTWDGDSCLCTRPCHICHPPKDDPAMRKLMGELLATPTSNTKETPMIDGRIRSDSCGPDDPGQLYIECPNCAAGRIYSLECDCCGWEEGQPLRDWSHRRLATPKEDNPDGN